MQTQTNSIKSTMITYGVILGGISIVFQLMLFFLDMHYQQPPAVGIVSLLIMTGLLLFAFVQFKKINEAYHVLIDDDERVKYDQHGSEYVPRKAPDWRPANYWTYNTWDYIR